VPLQGHARSSRPLHHRGRRSRGRVGGGISGETRSQSLIRRSSRFLHHRTDAAMGLIGIVLRIPCTHLVRSRDRQGLAGNIEDGIDAVLRLRGQRPSPGSETPALVAARATRSQRSNRLLHHRG
jgi:hypothetical protein